MQLANELGPEYADWLGHHYQFEAGFLMAIKTAVWQCFFNYNPDASYNRVLWTMEVELMGSFFLFAYLSVIGKHKARWLIYAITALVLFRLYMFWVNAFVLGTMLCDMYVKYKGGGDTAERSKRSILREIEVKQFDGEVCVK